ncbi:hypothetical protein RRG08_020338 [Elysia crispata]|uniref:Uncharacterized protein n=1 Tax=Elysia crispata TaxID=231223 RepID=A0AAE1DXQ8_9GAST|nr:hypothetical protein RRG08_020338 [Elysia crispata]
MEKVGGLLQNRLVSLAQYSRLLVYSGHLEYCIPGPHATLTVLSKPSDATEFQRSGLSLDIIHADSLLDTTWDQPLRGGENLRGV